MNEIALSVDQLFGADKDDIVWAPPTFGSMVASPTGFGFTYGAPQSLIIETERFEDDDTLRYSRYEFANVAPQSVLLQEKPSFLGLVGGGQMSSTIGTVWEFGTGFDVASNKASIAAQLEPLEISISTPSTISISENEIELPQIRAFSSAGRNSVQTWDIVLSRENGGGADNALFTTPIVGISDLGPVRDFIFWAPPDFEMPGDANGDNIYEVQVLVRVETDDGREATAVKDFQITVTNINEAPALTHLSTSLTFQSATVSSSPQLLDADVTLTDPENNFDGGMLTLSGILLEDTVSVQNVGTGAGEIGFDGTNVTFGGGVIGTLVGGNGADLSITFNASATAISIEALVESLIYSNRESAPSQSRDLVLNIADASGDDIRTGGFEVGDILQTIPPSTVRFDTKPSFIDLDGDGDLDLVSGNSYGTFSAFENRGSSFVELTGAANPFDGIDVGNDSAPMFVDLDRDGDLDLVSGEFFGALLSFENTNVGFVALTGVANPFDGIDVGNESAPTFVDLDGDGDLDLVSGDGRRSLLAFENTASGFVALSGTANPFDGLSLGNGSTRVSFVDLDGDGDFDLVSGADAGSLSAYENTGNGFSLLTGAKDPFSDFYVDDRLITPAFADVDGDGDLDLAVGGYFGILNVFENIDGGAQVLGQTIKIDLIAENYRPSLTGLESSVTFDENVVNATPQLIDADIVFDDPDSNFDGGTVTVSGILLEDIISVQNVGTGAGEIGFDGTNVTYEGVTIGALSGGNGADLTITLNASATSVSVDALLQHLTYANSSGAPTASRDLLINVTDDEGADLGGVPPGQTLTVNVIAQNDVPTALALPTDVSVAQQVGGPIDLSGLVLDDVDGDVLTVTLTVSEGVFGAPLDGSAVGGGVTATLVSSTSITLVGLAADINAYLSTISNLTYTPRPVVLGDNVATISITVNDGQGSGDISLGVVNVDVTPDNYAPTLTGLESTVTFNENTVNAMPQVLDADVTLEDLDSNFDGGTVTVSGLLAEDIISVRNAGNGVGEIGFNGAVVFYQSVAIGALSGGNGADLIITLNASATSLAVDALLENLTYANISDTPTSSRELKINITDADGANIGGGGSNGFVNGGQLTGSNNPFDGIDIGIDSVPSFMDVDGDSDLDLVVGEEGGTLQVWENTSGGAGFTNGGELTGTSNPFDGIDVSQYSSPSFIDIDGDGDLDLVSGEEYGALKVWENTAGIENGFINGGELTGASNPFDGINAGSYSKPAFIDIDGDGDLDVVVGNKYGTFRVWENSANATYGFVNGGELTGANNPFDGIDIGVFSFPSFVDLDGDGDLDFVAGEITGTFLVWDNTSGGAGFTLGSQLTGTDNPLDGVVVDRVSTPSFVDLDGDGDLDLVSGEYNGGFLVWENSAGVTPPGQTLTVNVTAENEVPLLSGGFTASVIQGLAVTLTTTDLDGADVEDAADSLTFVATDLFGGTLLIDGVSGTSFTRAQLAAGLVVFQHDNSSGDGSFSVSVQDSEGASSAPQTVTVTNSGLNTVNGTEDNDTLTGTEADDVLNGDAGNDTLTGSGGDDLLNGGSGADDLNGGGGFDTASYADDTAGVIFNLDSLTRDGVAKRRVLDGSGSTDTLSLIESAIGSAFDDSLWGNFLRNTLEGGAGNDSLYGRGGNDRLIGGLGDDLLNGASGVDIADYSGASSAVDVDLSVGLADDGDGGMDTLVSIESVIGSAFNDMFVGRALNDTFSGGSGADDAMGGEGNDTLRGGDDADTLNGEGGNDRLYGDDGADTINGGAGVDVIDGGLGADIINGGADGDRIFGRDGNDTINGDGGIDIINAQEGDDTIFGGDDRDLLRGNDGDDTISGDGGDDRIDGGADTDTVVYAGNQADYNIILRSNGVLSVDDLNLANGDEGYDVITNAEFLQFADGTVDISGL